MLRYLRSANKLVRYAQYVRRPVTEVYSIGKFNYLIITLYVDLIERNLELGFPDISSKFTDPQDIANSYKTSYSVSFPSLAANIYEGIKLSKNGESGANPEMERGISTAEIFRDYLIEKYNIEPPRKIGHEPLSRTVRSTRLAGQLGVLFDANSLSLEFTLIYKLRVCVLF